MTLNTEATSNTPVRMPVQEDLSRRLGFDRSANPSIGAINSGLNPQSGVSIHAPSSGINYQGDPENQTIIFDSDETLLASDKLTKTALVEAEKAGLEIKTTQTGSKYILRPGAKELLEYLRSKGHILILSSRNTNAYLRDLIESEPVLKNNFTFNNQILYLGKDNRHDPRNTDKKFKHHPNRISFWEKTKDWFKRNFSSRFKYWKQKREFKKGERLHEPRPPEPAGTENKYPPISPLLLGVQGTVSPAHILVDNKYRENLGHGKRSGDFVCLDPGQFDGNKAEPINEKNSYAHITKYKWAQDIIAGIEKGWKAEYKSRNGVEPRKDYKTLEFPA
jgi:hypothetical protein